MLAKSAEELDGKWKSASWFSGSSKPDHLSHLPNLRLRRALSWLDRAEKEYCRGGDVDADAAFIFYWIAFNAAYGQLGSPWSNPEKERDSFKKYLEKIIACDYNAIEGAIFPELASHVDTFVNNKYVYEPFWRHHNREQGYQDWERGYKSSTKARSMRSGTDTPRPSCVNCLIASTRYEINCFTAVRPGRAA